MAQIRYHQRYHRAICQFCSFAECRYNLPRRYRRPALLLSRPLASWRLAQSSPEWRLSNEGQSGQSFRGNLLFASPVSNILKMPESTDLLLNDMLVDFSSGDIIVLAQADIEISLVVSKIQIRLSTIIQYVHLT
jgi:hypothetical protein